MEIKLKSGLEVRVDGFHFGYTYGGLLEGMPNERINKNIFKRTNCPLGWGARKTLKIKPEKSEFKSELKHCYYAVWLHSNEPIEPECDGCELVVIWFGDKPDGRKIEEVITTGIEDINWKKNAEDFYY
jgi:hypothetical protein